MTAATRTSRTIEVFRPGTFTPMGGVPITFSAEDLRAVAAAYDAEGAPTPAVIGHPTVDAPAYGWAKSFSYDEASQRLMAEVDELDPAFAALVAEKKYRKVSLSFIRPADPENPKPGTWYPRHIGFLGATPPAVTGLKPVSFSGEADPSATFEFAAEGWIARLLRRLRDRMIEKDGLEVADEVLPDWELRALDELAMRSEAQASPAFASPQKEPQMTTAQQPADFAAREAALKTREEGLAARERQTRHAGNVSFAAELEAGGRILPVHKDRLVGVLDAIGNGDASVSFAGTAHAPDEALREILRELPQVVPYGRIPLDGGAPTTSADFATPEGATVDPEQLALHGRALGYQAQHPGTGYLDAVRAVQAMR
ncbi:hypothetical protein V5G24_00185 [Xanthobacter sp. VTT E-85241]|uniref:hypothetical protein n=1 Tax=Roseixanthobacter finlandensis TaxID=3119922 RepID=UPI00372A10A0